MQWRSDCSKPYLPRGNVYGKCLIRTAPHGTNHAAAARSSDGTELCLGSYTVRRRDWFLATADEAGGPGGSRAKYKSAYFKRGFTEAEALCMYKHLHTPIAGADMAGAVIEIDSYGGAINRKELIQSTAVSQRSSVIKISAQPQAVLFTGRGDCVLTVDRGNDTISILDANPSLRVRSRSALPPATGAVSLAIHHASQSAFVSGALSEALLTFRYNASKAAIIQPAKLIADGVSGPLAVHPTLEILYVSTVRGVAIYDFHRADEIHGVQHLDIDDGAAESQSLQFSPFFNALFMCTGKGLLQISADRASGLLHAPRYVSTVRHAQSVAFL